MVSSSFRKPTIKDTSRAYVRLFQYFKTNADWLAFLVRYEVRHVPFGHVSHGDCAVRVIERATGEVARLGLDIPIEIKYHTYVATARSFWNESFVSDTHVRERTIEVGYSEPSRDVTASLSA